MTRRRRGCRHHQFTQPVRPDQTNSAYLVANISRLR
jgi:hypothetical protein